MTTRDNDAPRADLAGPEPGFLQMLLLLDEEEPLFPDVPAALSEEAYLTADLCAAVADPEPVKRYRCPPVEMLGGRGLSVKQAALHARRSEETIRRWCREGRLAYKLDGRDLRVSATDLLAVIDGRLGVSVSRSGGAGQVVFGRLCANPRCSNSAGAIVGKRGGGTKDRRYCCFECQQAVYRMQVKARAKRRKKALVATSILNPA